MQFLIEDWRFRNDFELSINDFEEE